MVDRLGAIMEKLNAIQYPKIMIIYSKRFNCCLRQWYEIQAVWMFFYMRVLTGNETEIIK